MKNHFLLLLLIVAFFGCKKPDHNGCDPYTMINNNGLPGTWELRSTVSGLTGSKTGYPAGNGQLLVLTNASYQFYKDGSIISQGNYTLTKKQSLILNKLADCIIFSTSQVVNLIDLNGDTLSLAPDAYDGGSTEYVRIK